MKKSILFLLTLYLSLIVCYGQSIAENKTLDTTIRKCPPFSITDINKISFNLEKLKNKLIVINMIGYKNIQPPKVIKELVDFSNNYSKSDIVFIAITGNINADIQVLESLFYSGNYSLVIMNMEEYKQTTLLMNPFPATPLNFIIDRKGKIVYSKYSYFSDEELRDYKKRISSLVKK